MTQSSTAVTTAPPAQPVALPVHLDHKLGFTTHHGYHYRVAPPGA